MPRHQAVTDISKIGNKYRCLIVLKKKYICICIIVLILLFYLLVPVFHGLTYQEAENFVDIYDEKYASKYEWYKVKYTNTTGINFVVEESSDKSMINKYVLIENWVDPRYLEINSDFSIDFSGSLYIISRKKSRVNFMNEDVWRLDAKKIFVYTSNTEAYSNYYTVSDVNWIGIIKMFVGVIYRPARYIN